MKRINKLFLPFILLTSSLMAESKVYSFIGIQAGTTVVSNEASPTLGLKYGQQTKNFRTTLSYNFSSNKATSHTLLAQIDMGILRNSFRNLPFKPYMGLVGGVMQFDDKVTDRGYLYGMGTGIAYMLNDKIDFDLAYRYLQTSKIKEFNHLSNVSLAMHYFY